MEHAYNTAPAPEVRPRIAFGPQRTADNDTYGTEENGKNGQQQPEPVDPKCSHRVSNNIAEEGVFVLRRFNGLTLLRIYSRQIREPCSASAKHVVKNKAIAIICAGL